jgi:DNA-binding CsgD family transcriptional regulator
VDQVIDRIYEAAFVPDRWPDVLDTLGEISNSASASVLVFSAEDQPPRYKTTALTEAALHEFTTTDLWRRSERVPSLFSAPPPGAFSQFLYLDDFLTPDQKERDSVQNVLRDLGLGAQITALVPMMSGEVVSFTLERPIADGRHQAGAIAALDGLRPHLARAGLIAARLGLERAQAAASTLQRLGVPAAVLTAAGRVLATNGLLDRLPGIFQPTAFGGMAITAPTANLLFQAAVSAQGDGSASRVRSIPVAANEQRPACVLHLLPLERSARDIFSGGDVVLAATIVDPARSVPSVGLLTGLFDLSPAEARLARTLAAGASVAEAANASQITVKSARSYLERIFVKTGTHRQGELTALLKSASPLSGGDEHQP